MGYDSDRWSLHTFRAVRSGAVFFGRTNRNVSPCRDYCASIDGPRICPRRRDHSLDRFQPDPHPLDLHLQWDDGCELRKPCFNCCDGRHSAGRPRSIYDGGHQLSDRSCDLIYTRFTACFSHSAKPGYIFLFPVGLPILHCKPAACICQWLRSIAG